MAIRRIKEFLDGNKVKYVVITHSPAYTAQEVAASAHIPGKYLAKTVIVELDGKLAMAVVPADHGVELELLRSAAGAQSAGLADESQFFDRFEGCKLGAMPPLGALFGIETYVDRELARQEYISFNAGTHTDVIAMRFNDFRKLAKPNIAHLTCETVAHTGLKFVQL